ncbi:MAG: T9SS type A sorting domain-containing protein [Chitinophagales bacterium]
MKRILALAVASFFTLFAYGQNDTLDYPFFDGQAATIFSAPGGGFVAGSNLFNTEIGQVFETTSGDLTSFVFWAGELEKIGAPDTFTIKVYDATQNGLPTGPSLGSILVNSDSIFAGSSFADGGNLFFFNPPVAVSGKFAVTIEVDLTAIDDTLGLVTIEDNLNSGRSIGGFPGAPNNGWLKLENAWVNWAENIACWVTLENVDLGASISSKGTNARCTGETDTLYTTVSGAAVPLGQLQVQWDPITGLSDPNALKTNVNLDAAIDSYTVTIFDGDSTFTAGVKYTFADITIDVNGSNPLLLDCGGNIDISTTIDGATLSPNYTWVSGNDTIGFGAILNDVDEPGTYTVNVVNSPGCSASANVAVELDVAVAVDFEVPSGNLYEGDQISFTNNSSSTSGWSFTWLVNGNEESTSEDFLFTFSDAGSYTVTLVADTADGLCDKSTTKNVGIQEPTGIEEALQGELVEVFPNPSNGVFSLDLRSVNSTDITVRVVDLTGKTIFRQDKIAGNSVYNLDLNNVSEGVYLLQVITEENTLINKLQVTK